MSGTGTVYECQSDAFILKIAQLDRGVLWRIKNRVGYLIECDRFKRPVRLLRLSTPGQGGKQSEHSQGSCKFSSFHGCLLRFVHTIKIWGIQEGVSGLLIFLSVSREVQYKARQATAGSIRGSNQTAEAYVWQMR